MSGGATNRSVEIRRFQGAARALEELLQLGPTDSRLAITTLKAAGASAKQIRSARERLGVVIRRQGNRREMRSIWALPERVVVAAPGNSGLEHRAIAASATSSTSDPEGSVLNCSGGQPGSGSSAQPTSPAQSRLSRRADFFGERGLAVGDALELAAQLEIRDQVGETVVSCIECQCWVQTGWCSARRPAGELHPCSFIRREGP